MTLSQWQAEVARFVAAHDLAASETTRMLDFVSEVGELSKEILRGSDYGRAPVTLKATWPLELGDTLFALLCLANTTEVDLEQALAQAMEKYRARLEATGEAGSEQSVGGGG
ncbi:MAG: nucleotide pyrophosphohydrolase [Chloroflexi bacterium]|jgi:NTP pyrophosphatase (non-canonical NTP hydrolase)|nr:nucleotide pyrophosphohydrolase [Chloroflexota bacterium]